MDGGSTDKPIVLRYRDGLEAFRFLFGNPVFAGQQDFKPTRIVLDREGKIRRFGGPMTGDLPWEIQVRILNAFL